MKNMCFRNALIIYYLHNLSIVDSAQLTLYIDIVE